MIPKRLITTWICDPEHDRYTERHRAMFAHCLTSWLRLMPDYELVIITLGSLRDAADGLEAAATDDWLQARLAAGHWIAASHWARLEALYRLGGIYVDADVEAVRRFDPLIVDRWLTVGHLGNGQGFANNAVIASPAGHPLLARWQYATTQADPADPEFGNHTGPFLLTNLLKLGHWDGSDQTAVVQVPGDCGSSPVWVRRSKVFYPYTWNEAYSPACHAADTMAVHHWASSWRPPNLQPQQVWRNDEAPVCE